MNIKWSIIGLTILGVVAAVCAALFTTSLRAQALNLAALARPSEVTVLIASQDLPAGTVIDGALLLEKTMQAGSVPEDRFFEPTDLIGRVVSAPMVEGQAFAEMYLAVEGTGASLAARLSEGMRAVSVSLGLDSGLERLLYPGCKVDVLATFKLPADQRKVGQAVSTTLLQNVEVLAVEEETVVSARDRNQEGESSSARASKRDVLVSLLVDPKQAEALQLAMLYGSLSLTLRNPLDELPVDREVTLLSQGQLAQLASFLGATVDAEGAAGGPEDPQNSLGPEDPEGGGSNAASERTLPQWKVHIFRGLKSESRSFPMPGRGGTHD